MNYDYSSMNQNLPKVKYKLTHLFFDPSKIVVHIGEKWSVSLVDVH